MRNTAFIILIVLCGSCAGVMFPGTNDFHRLPVYITELQSDSCRRDTITLRYQTKILRARIPFVFVSSVDTLAMDIYPGTGSTFYGHQNLKPYIITFAGPREQRDGYLFLIEEADTQRRFIVALRCSDYK